MQKVYVSEGKDGIYFIFFFLLYFVLLFCRGYTLNI